MAFDPQEKGAELGAVFKKHSTAIVWVRWWDCFLVALLGCSLVELSALSSVGH